MALAKRSYAVMLDGFVVSTSQVIYSKLLHEAEEEIHIYDCKWLLKMEPGSSLLP